MGGGGISLLKVESWRVNKDSLNLAWNIFSFSGHPYQEVPWFWNDKIPQRSHERWLKNLNPIYNCGGFQVKTNKKYSMKKTR